MRVSMAARDVTLRLRRVAQLRRLCLALARSRPLPPPAAPAEPAADTSALPEAPYEGLDASIAGAVEGR